MAVRLPRYDRNDGGVRMDLELTIPQSALQTGLGQSKVDFALGHRKRGTYAFAHLAPTKYYQYFFPASQVGQLVPLHKGAFSRKNLI